MKKLFLASACMLFCVVAHADKRAEKDVQDAIAFQCFMTDCGTVHKVDASLSVEEVLRQMRDANLTDCGIADW